MSIFGGGAGGGTGGQFSLLGSIEDVFQLLNRFVGTPVFGILYDLGIVGPENRERFQQFVDTQNAGVDFQNEINKSLGLPQIAVPGSAFATSQSNLEFHQGQLALLDPNDPSQAGAIAAEEEAIAKAESELALPEDTALSQVQDIGEETGQLARDFFSPEATQARLDETVGGTEASLLANTALFNRRTSETQAGFEGILSRAQGLVEGLGEQEREDIETRADAQASAEQARLAARGLGGTTVTSSQAALSEESRADQLGRLNERLVREKLGVEATFGLAGLGFQERAGQFGANLGLGTTALQQRAGEFSFGELDASQKTLIDQLISSGLLGPDFELSLANSQAAQGVNPIPPTNQPGTGLPGFGQT